MWNFFLLFAAAIALPCEGLKDQKPVRDPTFTNRLNAFVWRNWFCVEKDRLSETLGVSSSELTKMAGEMSLPADPKIELEWKTKGYVTILRRNWQLLPYEQILTLLGWSREKLAFHLLEDDYLFQKMGNSKPYCERLEATAEEIARGRRERCRIAEILREEGVNASSGAEPRFSFVRDLSEVPKNENRHRFESGSASPFETRLMFSYFADYADPLMDDSIGSYPEGLLARYAEQGINAVWLHVVLRSLAKDPFFVEFGEGSEKRQANLRKLVSRAKKYGIQVFLYMNEPRPMPCGFFEKNEAYRACRGTLEWRGMTNAMCTQAPEVRRWIRSAMEEVFRSVPGLAGIFIINRSENLVTCVSHGDKRDYENDKTGHCRPECFCKVCQSLPSSRVLADDASLLIEGMQRANPSARAFYWDWGWKNDDAELRKLLSLLPKDNVGFLTMSVKGKSIDVDGVKATINEYTLSQVGPSVVALPKWAMARQNGLSCIAKAQVSSSWEMAIVPYVPVMDNIAVHAWNLMREGIDGVMLSWSCGCYPSPNLRVFTGVRKTDRGPENVLDRIAAELYGNIAAPMVREAWSVMSQAFSRYPFNNETLHVGPHHWGPANPLYMTKSGCKATMVGTPYDDLESWRSIFPASVYVGRCQQVADGFDKASELWKTVIAKCHQGGRKQSELEYGIIRTVSLHMASCADQARFVLARERDDHTEMRMIARRELERAKELLPLVERDSRLGYECSCQYFYTPQDLREKIINCRGFDAK